LRIKRYENGACCPLTYSHKKDVQSLEVVELAALLHDIDDWKYATVPAAGAAVSSKAGAFLSSLTNPPLQTEEIVFILEIIDHMGFKESLSGERCAEVSSRAEFHCVQDADRLDAIGAVGIARCLSYGGHKKRLLYDPSIPPSTSLTKEEYMGQQAPTVNHFFEKLFLLKDQMHTAAAREMAASRHAFMQLFLRQLFEDIRGP
jgi:uncharacterized protein